MEIRVLVNEEGVYADLAGEFDLASAAEFRRRVDQALDRGGPGRLVVNLRGVDFLDSSGLAAILGRYKRLQGNGGQMTLQEPQPQVRRVLELSGVLQLVRLEEAGAGEVG